MHFSWVVLCSWLLATLPPPVLSAQIHDIITGSGGVIKAAKKTHARGADEGVDLEFGGKEHGSDNKDDQHRPEMVKTQVCEEPSSKCSECTTQASCWRGKGNGELSLDVSASNTASYYAAEMWASCSGGNGRWVVVVWPFLLGVLKIFVDGLLQHTIQAGEIAEGDKSRLDIVVAKNSRVRVLFERLANQAASAQVKLKAVGVDAYVDGCMGVTNCLASLGDGSDSAFLFRNSNKLQLKCLRTPSHKLIKRQKVSDHCDPWATCVSNSGLTAKLEALLGASLTPHGSLAEGKINMQKFNDAEGCVDPSVADPESWDCECMDSMTESCKGEDLEECIHKILCANTNVCESWQGTHCEESLLAKHKISTTASQNKSAALMRQSAKRAIAIVDDRLDSALSGKCTSETQ